MKWSLHDEAWKGIMFKLFINEMVTLFLEQLEIRPTTTVTPLNDLDKKKIKTKRLIFFGFFGKRTFYSALSLGSVKKDRLYAGPFWFPRESAL